MAVTDWFKWIEFLLLAGLSSVTRKRNVERIATVKIEKRLALSSSDEPSLRWERVCKILFTEALPNVFRY